MKRPRRPPLVLALLCSLGAASPQPSIEIRPSTTNVTLGERFRVVLEASSASGATFEFPKQVNNGSIELTAATPPSPRPNEIVYDAQLFAMGAEARIPEIEVHYKERDGSVGTVKTAPIPLNLVSSLDPNETNPAPADYAPPQPVLVSRAFWVASGMASLLLIALFVMIARRLRFPKPPVEPKVTPALSPEEEALSLLERLSSARSTLEARTFYIQIVQTLKQYLERRLAAPVLEMTSTETLAFVKNHAWTAPLAMGIRELISSADLVKFGGSSDATNAERQIQLARDVVSRVDRLRRAEQDLDSRNAGARKTA
jgi:hypothetical protein